MTAPCIAAPYKKVSLPCAHTGKDAFHAINAGIAAGPHHNEELLGRVLKGRRNEMVIATKFACTTHSPPNGKPEYVREAVEGSLKRLQVDYIDLCACWPVARAPDMGQARK